MPDLLPVSLVEMISELERDLLARKRVYHNRTYTRRLSLEKAERRLAIVAAILDNLRGQMSPQQLETLDVLHERKVEQRKQRAQLKKHRHARV